MTPAFFTKTTEKSSSTEGSSPTCQGNGCLRIFYGSVVPSHFECSYSETVTTVRFIHCSGPVEAYVLARPSAIPHWRTLLGTTKVFKTIHVDPESLRGRYGLTDTRNVLHGSGVNAWISHMNLKLGVP